MNSSATTSSSGIGRKVFFVEDDALIVDIYRKKFLQEGFDVQVAQDGLAALKMLATEKPDVVVLDLMMPKLSGADVLKFIRSKPELKSVPVIILSNSYMTDAAHEAAVAGADKALLKSRCTPRLLLNVIGELFSGISGSVDKSVLLAVPEIYAKPAEPVSPPSHSAAPATAPQSQASVREAPKKEEQSPPVDAKVLRSFLDNAPAAVASMRQLYDAFLNCPDPKTQPMRLEDVHRKVHFFTSLASLTGCYQIAQLSSALEALLMDLRDRPQLIGHTTRETVSHSIDFFGDLVNYARTAHVEPLPPANVIVIDDDILSNRLVVSALHRANFNAASANDPLKALTLLQEKKFDLILLDVSMPLMDGFEFCGRLRSLDRYKKTPIIFVTCRTDFDSREQGIRSGGNDVIAKPILPLELAVKAVTHLLMSQLPNQPEKKVGRF